MAGVKPQQVRKTIKKKKDVRIREILRQNKHPALCPATDGPGKIKVGPGPVPLGSRAGPAIKYDPAFLHRLRKFLQNINLSRSDRGMTRIPVFLKVLRKNCKFSHQSYEIALQLSLIHI